MSSQDKAMGVLLPVSSLPAKDIGHFGQVAKDFLDQLHKAGQKIWQVLPIGPTIVHDSPFYSPSAFAISPNYIDLDDLVEKKYLTRKEVDSYYEKFTQEHPNKINYGLLWEEKIPLLEAAFTNFSKKKKDKNFTKFVTNNTHWLKDFSLFMGIKKLFADDKKCETWTAWPNEFKIYEKFQETWKSYSKDAKSLSKDQQKQYQEIEEQAEFHKFLQWLSSEQWFSLKEIAKKKGIAIIGDCPIYVAPDSADVWANRTLFKFTEDYEQDAFAGVPPDYFSPKYGQFWGNPIYKWFQEDGSINEPTFAWWSKRLQHQLSLFDKLRIDHFRGFAAYWEIPRGQSDTTNEEGEVVKTAKHGAWLEGPGQKLFDYVANDVGKKVQDLDIIAEDLGVITKEVNSLREYLEAPGMGIFQFAPWTKLKLRTSSGEFEDLTNKDQLIERNIDLGSREGWERIYYENEDSFTPFTQHEFLPHNGEKTGKTLFYPGTHDNETFVGWYRSTDRDDLEKEIFHSFLNYHVRRLCARDEELSDYLSEGIMWQSIRVLTRTPEVHYAVFQMQDLLELENFDTEIPDIQCRTNTPNEKGQWQWKLGGNYLFDKELEEKLLELAQQSKRA